MYVHDPGPKKSYDDGVIYIRTRYVVSKTDTDKEVKEKLLQDIVVRYIIRSFFRPAFLTFLVSQTISQDRAYAASNVKTQLERSTC